MFKLILFFVFVFLASCNDENPTTTSQPLAIKACDLSFLPALEQRNIVFYNTSGNPQNMLDILKSKGMNTVRVRLWHSPTDQNSSFEQVESFAQIIKQKGLKLWLSVHYSDTWADPSAQQIPFAWQNLSFTTLKDSVYQYTKKIVQKIQPDYIQIGNEINSGMLFPHGSIQTQETQFTALLASGIGAVRTYRPSCKIILHYAGYENPQWFFEKVKNLDYNIIGLSYYPIWHGKNIQQLKSNINMLTQQYQKKMLIAETAYPFTLGWNDWTNNIVGMENQIISSIPPTQEGQKEFLMQLNSLLRQNAACLGYCYWGAELVAFDGNHSTNGSPWENQALFDFNNKVVIAAGVFGK